MIFSPALVPRPPRGEELLHADDLHVDAWRGQLPAAPAHQHVAGQDVADLDHRRLLLDAPALLHRALHVGQGQQPRRGPQVSRVNKIPLLLFLVNGLNITDVMLALFGLSVLSCQK